MNAHSVEVPTLANFVGGRELASSSGRSLPIVEPNTGSTIGHVPLSSAGDLDHAVLHAVEAQKEWGDRPLKDRVQVLFRLKRLFEDQMDHLVDVIIRENGKTEAEAIGSVARAVECVEFATSLPQIALGHVLEVSRGVECKVYRYPLGVVAGITPFNFPFMVPLWMIPIALGLGNAFVLKPSEQTPLSGMEIARLLHEAGLPDGVFSVMHGDREIVEALCDNEFIKAIGFVGSTSTAKAVYARATATGKRVRAMGGAKNHLVVMPDADPEMTASNVVSSATGCAGQRCMAASVLLAVGDVDHILALIRDKMAAMQAGRDIGSIISPQAYEKITGYLDRASENGAELWLDGRSAVAEGVPKDAHYLGPCILVTGPDHEAAEEEIFGPTLTVVRCDSLEQALSIENSGRYGNAAAIYTSSGGTAEYFIAHASAGMVGVNIGVPVPREPFAFGGWNESAFGGGDITGMTAIDFWSRTKKITTKWSARFKANWMS